MAEYGDGEFQRLETNRIQKDKEQKRRDYRNSKILTESEVFDELELMIYYHPHKSNKPIRYAVKDGIIVVLDTINASQGDTLYEIFTDYKDFNEFTFEYFLLNSRDFDTVYELLTKQEVISTLVRCKPAKYVFV